MMCELKDQPFAVKHYSADEYPSIKGNGFDGIRIGEDREEATEFIRWVNSRLELLAIKSVEVSDSKAELARLTAERDRLKQLVDTAEDFRHQNKCLSHNLDQVTRERDALAAEVRALRKDRERLDWMQQMNSEVFWINAKLCEVTLGLTVGSGEADDLRSAIDAALDAAKGE